MAGILYTTVLFFLQNKRNNMSRQNVLYEKWAEIEIKSHTFLSSLLIGKTT